MGLFNEEGDQNQLVLSDPEGSEEQELTPGGKDNNSDHLERQRRAFFKRGNWKVDWRGITYNKGRHNFNVHPRLTYPYVGFKYYYKY